jgi:hypothetical protein
MATRTFLAQHGDGAGDRAGEPQQDMNAHYGQKDWISGGYFNSRYVRNPFGHADCFPQSSTSPICRVCENRLVTFVCLGRFLEPSAAVQKR